eukprot:CAMPEP_0202898058 /NCGR_PEP_ID=MMETSP1392-20130828/6669_1 /ASSEMBLY_ACC=CAM_ASM_000868 /TAXON_ID=225041 /ORGANISM="Chlamydomonas chlamydogama, Strain SAG 11-48b" /LENGTH=155 /DNA_ID=CAMNT_0049583875 /DNA_START=232 /DNA_END=700 /DNA_ORIENTATION=-
MVSTTQSMSGGISGLDSQQSSPVAQPSAVATPSPSSSSVTPAAVGSGAGTSSSSSSSSTGVPGSQASSSKQYGTSYYAGLISSDIRQDNNASGGDMLKRSLQLAGGVALLLALLTAAFLKSNGDTETCADVRHDAWIILVTDGVAMVCHDMVREV